MADACEIVTIDAVIEGRGYGSALLEAVAHVAGRAGCSRLWLITTNDNERAIGFYRAHGFDVVGRPRRRDRRVAEAEAIDPSRQRARRADKATRSRWSAAVVRRDGTPVRREEGPNMQKPASPDPIGDPKGYQDASARPAWGRRSGGGAGRDAGLAPTAVHARPARTCTLRPEPTEWSALECMAHIMDAEVVMSGRYRWVLAHDEPPLIGYDQDLWVDQLHGDDDLDGLIDLFDALRLANVTLWQRTPGGSSASGSASTRNVAARATTSRSA